ncbi:MAG: outer membrane lipoprotein chaperone LolA [Rhodocyclaceae bacterium]|nr:outer membrane lipoprotein chaperone LolA [Rhodocyclaceae bacterium]
MKSLSIPLLTLALWCNAATAGGIDQLKSFLAETKSAKASFSQVVAGKSGKKQESSGSMAFSRPGKFRWSYEKPYQQLLVSDGVKLWSYDKDLEQVTIKKLGDALGNTPAAFLAGSGDLEKNFTLSEPGKVEGVEVVDAVPKDKDSTFQRVRIGFVDKLPKMMEVRDNFGQVTTLLFTGFERNPSLPAGTFTFVPPKGVDVVGE